MYNSRIKNRKLKKIIGTFINITKYQTNNFCIKKKTILFSILLGYISLFLNWIKIGDSNSIILYNGFNKITIFNSLVIFLLLSFNLFLLFSINKKDKIKFLINIKLKDSNLLVISNIIILLLSLSSIYTIIGLKIFYLNINYGKGIIYMIISGIIGLIASSLLKKINNHKIIIDESENQNQNQNNNNMKLPI